VIALAVREVSVAPAELPLTGTEALSRRAVSAIRRLKADRSFAPTRDDGAHRTGHAQARLAAPSRTRVALDAGDVHRYCCRGAAIAA
jgi:hypothetical protein